MKITKEKIDGRDKLKIIPLNIIISAEDLEEIYSQDDIR